MVAAEAEVLAVVEVRMALVVHHPCMVEADIAAAAAACMAEDLAAEGMFAITLM